MNKFKHYFVYGPIGIVILFLTGCGTFHTIFESDATVQGSLAQVQSPCESIPRFYSGTAYNICVLRGKPSKTTLWMGAVPELFLADVILSGALDTVALPYTFYTQATHGNITLK